MVLINNHQLSILKEKKKRTLKKKNIISFKETPDFYEYLVLKPEGYCLHSFFNFEELLQCKKNRFSKALTNTKTKCEVAESLLVLGQACKAFFPKK